MRGTVGRDKEDRTLGRESFSCAGRADERRASLEGTPSMQHASERMMSQSPRTWLEVV